MGTEQLHDPLLQAARNHLKDLEEPFDGSDWDRMERSLDQLPKTRTFKWSYSLNTVLVAVGVAALSWGAYAMLGNTGETNKPAVAGKPKQQQVAPAVAVKKETPAPVLKPENNTSAAVVATAFTTAVPENNTAIAQNEVKTKRKRNPEQVAANPENQPGTAEKTPSNTGDPQNFSDLVFGDQLDKRMGPVKETQEDLSQIGDVPAVDPAKLPYYDFLNGKSVPIPVNFKPDSSKKTGPPKNEESRNNTKQQGNNRPIR